MKKNLFIPVVFMAVLCTSCSCDGDSLTKKAAKKTTEMALDVVEGVSEAIEERGDKLGEKVADATGKVAQGAGRSIARQLDEHAATVASVAGRTLVQSLDGLEKGLYTEFYTKLDAKKDLADNVSLDFMGLMNNKPVVDAYFIITQKGSYACRFDFYADNCETVAFSREATIEYNADKKYTSVSFALNDDEVAIAKTAQCIKVSVKQK